MCPLKSSQLTNVFLALSVNPVYKYSPETPYFKRVLYLFYSQDISEHRFTPTFSKVIELLKRPVFLLQLVP